MTGGRDGRLASTPVATATALSGAPAFPTDATLLELQAPSFHYYSAGDVCVTAETDRANTTPGLERFVLDTDRTAVWAALKAAFRDGRASPYNLPPGD